MPPSPPPAGALSPAPIPVEVRWVHAAGARLSYATLGSGPPLVLCHGFLGTGEEFCQRFAPLAAARTVIVPNLPGSGGSPRLHGRQTGEALAEVVDAMLRALRIEDFGLAGLCLGSGVACALAARRDDVRRLVLHTPLLAPGLISRAVRTQIKIFTTPGLYEVTAWASRQRAISGAWKRLFSDGPDADPLEQEVAFANQLLADPHASREWLLDGITRDDRAVLRRPGRSTLIIVSGDDRMVDVPLLTALAREESQVELLIDTGTGHGWGDLAVARQRDTLLAFLDGRPLPQGADLETAG
ncbi:MAG: alpha/beta fold hydrolase [Candidatus Dormibacteria bacterium]